MFRKLEQDNLIPLAKDKNANFPKIEIELTRIQTALDQTSLQWLRRCFFMLNRDNYVCSTLLYVLHWHPLRKVTLSKIQQPDWLTHVTTD